MKEEFMQAQLKYFSKNEKMNDDSRLSRLLEENIKLDKSFNTFLNYHMNWRIIEL